MDTHAPLASHPLAHEAIEAFLAGVAAADPTVLVRRAVRQGLLDDWFGERERPRPIHVLALGKAAPRMVWGLVEAGVPFSGFGVAPKGVRVPLVDTMRWMAGDHPVPGAQSFAAGRALLAWADGLPEGAPVLALLSGGASACVEAADGMAEGELARRWEGLLRSGQPIEAMNRTRASWSALKGGKLGLRLLRRTPNVRAWLLADTDPARAAAVVGSGPLWQEDGSVPHRILAGNGEAVAAAGLRLGAMGHAVYRLPERIHGAVEGEAARFVASLQALPAGATALVGGGEPTVAVPPGSPPGGRCQHAALAAARHLHEAGLDALFFAGATDGVDGAGAAGAWSVARDWDAQAGDALRRLDAQSFLRRRGRLLAQDPTGTNVNDLWVALRR